MGKKVMIKTTPLKYNFREHDLTIASETTLHYDAIRHMTVWEVVGSSLFGLIRHAVWVFELWKQQYKGKGNKGLMEPLHAN